MARNEVPPTCELGRRLEKERLNLGISKIAWINLLETTRPTYLGWMRGVEPQRQNMRTISRLLDVDLGEVYNWVEGGGGELSAHNQRYDRRLGRTAYRTAAALLAV